MGKDLAGEIKNQLARHNKVSSGELINSIRHEVRPVGNDYEVIIHAKEYLKYIDEGRKPGGKMPPIKPIEKWVRNKVATDDVEGTAWAIAWGIKHYGIIPTHIIQPAVDKIVNKWLDKIKDAVTKEIIKKIFNKI